jgi:hypothetical protein
MNKVINIYNLKINNKDLPLTNTFLKMADQGTVFTVKQECNNLVKK